MALALGVVVVCREVGKKFEEYFWLCGYGKRANQVAEFG
jgi:hypothetical protein